MIRIGLVNLETSHPLGFAKSLLRSGRGRYVGVYHDGFRGEDEVAGFMRAFGPMKRYDSLEELAQNCDIGFVQGCNWDQHLEHARPFIQQNKPVFLDKPMVGNEKDLLCLQQYAFKGARVIGSSSARYAYEINDFLLHTLAPDEKILQVFGTCGVDEFNYGIHIVEAIGGILGDVKATTVCYQGRTAHTDSVYIDCYHIAYATGQSAVCSLMTGVYQPFTLTVMTTKTTHQIVLDANRLYDALLEEILNDMENKKSRLASFEQLAQSIRIMLGLTASRAQGGARIDLEALSAYAPSYDGAAFARQYAQNAQPLYANIDGKK